uniref:Uncharacterized protein n=1 Tax=White spot syndrome virus TaxID=342409 RepID=A0A8E7EZV7_9VIRU|nr:MAG: hypothetical protein EDAONDGI_00129 [White spot syndrome virus]
MDISNKTLFLVVGTFFLTTCASCSPTQIVWNFMVASFVGFLGHKLLKNITPVNLDLVGKSFVFSASLTISEEARLLRIGNVLRDYNGNNFEEYEEEEDSGIEE